MYAACEDLRGYGVCGTRGAEVKGVWRGSRVCVRCVQQGRPRRLDLTADGATRDDERAESSAGDRRPTAGLGLTIAQLKAARLAVGHSRDCGQGRHGRNAKAVVAATAAAHSLAAVGRPLEGLRSGSGLGSLLENDILESNLLCDELLNGRSSAVARHDGFSDETFARRERKRTYRMRRMRRMMSALPDEVGSVAFFLSFLAERIVPRLRCWKTDLARFIVPALRRDACESRTHCSMSASLKSGKGRHQQPRRVNAED
jgi:hypothetical protein